jgi:beta-barrel assembly-enhancing protease
MDLHGIDFLRFQGNEAAVGPPNVLFRVALSHAIRPSKPRTLLKCEKPFTAWSLVTARGFRSESAYSSRTIPGEARTKRLPSPIRYYAWLVICAAGLLFGGQSVWASDVPGSRTSNAAEEAPSSTSSTSQPAPVIEEKTEKSGKYDVSRIGQRSIGHGVNLYSLQKERALGESMASAIDRGTRFVADPEINDYISRLGQKIARNSDAQVVFTVKVIDSPDLRIFSLPGGFLYVGKGLIMEVDSEAELAGLMAHEIAHVAARHATRFATRKYAWNVLSIPIACLSGPAALGTKQIGPLTLKKFSRDAEMEADLLGIEYQYAAGYDPQTYVEALEKLQSKDVQMRERIAKALPVAGKVPLHDQIARAFANYPPIEERIQKAQTEISALLPGRNDYVVDTSEFQAVKAKLAWADRPILRRHHAGDGPTNGPVLHRHPSQEYQPYKVADRFPVVTKGRLSSVFSYLPVFP